LNDSDFWGNTFPFQAHLLEVANESR
jgi:hypothetical protein